LLNKDDVWHDLAIKIRLDLIKKNYNFVTTKFILLEVGDALCSPMVRENTDHFIANIAKVKYVEVISLSDGLLNDALALYQSRLDKSWGLTDCISFVVMQQENITKAFTTDKHFEQAGFIRLLK